MLAQYWDNIGWISRVSGCVGFDASYSAHVPDTGVIIFKAHTHGATCSWYNEVWGRGSCVALFSPSSHLKGIPVSQNRPKGRPTFLEGHAPFNRRGGGGSILKSTLDSLRNTEYGVRSSLIGSITEVKQRRARFIIGWVTAWWLPGAVYTRGAQRTT